MIKKMFILFLFTIVNAVPIFEGITENIGCVNIDRNSLLSCFTQFDTNSDGNISILEMQYIYNVTNFINFGMLTPEFALEICDVNMDGVLNILDWNRYNSCCKSKHSIYWTCNICIKAGWTIPTKK